MYVFHLHKYSMGQAQIHTMMVSTRDCFGLHMGDRDTRFESCRSHTFLHPKLDISGMAVRLELCFNRVRASVNMEIRPEVYITHAQTLMRGLL